MTSDDVDDLDDDAAAVVRVFDLLGWSPAEIARLTGLSIDDVDRVLFAAIPRETRRAMVREEAARRRRGGG